MEAVNPSASSEYFHKRIVRSRPAEATCEGEIILAALIEDVCPPLPAGAEVASTSDDIFHILTRPS